MRLVAAAWVVPVSGPPIRDGVVALNADRVAFVGPKASPEQPAGSLLDLGDAIVLPGLVNAHCHLELSALAGRVPGQRGFTAWVAELVARRASIGPEQTRSATAEAIAGLERSGTVAVGDVSNALAHLDLLADSSLEAVVFYEQIGWDPASAAEILASADARLAAVGGPRPAPNVRVRFAAHAPHSVSAALFRGLRARGGPAALHLAESPDETRFLATGDGEWRSFLEGRVGEVAFAPPGLSPVEYARGLGILQPGLVAAHCVQVGASDRAQLAENGVAVAVCPRSNRSLGVGIPPVPELLADGVLVALGTDSLASAPSLDLLEDAVALHREFPALDPAAILRMATQSGARALGLSDLGTLAPGKRAALCYARAPADVADPVAFLLSGSARTQGLRL